MKKSLCVKGLFTLAAIGFLIGGPASALAQPQDFGEERSNRKEQREAFLETLTDSQKDTLEQSKALRDAGDHEAAKVLMEEAGIEGPGNKKGGEKNGERKEAREAAKAAVEANDYDAFLEATKNSPTQITLTEEQFNGVHEIRDLKEDGKIEEAKELAKKLELPKQKTRGEVKKYVESLTDDQKEIIKEAKELRKAGDKDAAKEILEDAGIEMPERKGIMKRIRGWFTKTSA